MLLFFFIIIIWERPDSSKSYWVQAQELLANITLLEVAVLKLEEQCSILQSEVGHARTEREIAELKVYSTESAHFKLEGSNLRLSSPGSSGTLRDDHSIKLIGSNPMFDGQHLNTIASSTSIETPVQQSYISPGCPVVGQESELGQPQKYYKVCFFRPAFRSSAFSYPMWRDILFMSIFLVILCHLMFALFGTLVGTTGSYTAAGSSFSDFRDP